MDVAIGLPNAVPGTTRRADHRVGEAGRVAGLLSLGTIDRIVYDNYEPLTALAAAAAVTERIGLCTSVLLGPLRLNATELAKQALSVNALSGGRFVLGIGLGGREDDYRASGHRDRAAAARRSTRCWSGSRRSGRATRHRPSVAGPPRLIIGGAVDASSPAPPRFGDGWIAGGSWPESSPNRPRR